MRQIILLVLLAIAIPGCRATQQHITLSVEQPTPAGGVARAAWNVDVR